MKGYGSVGVVVIGAGVAGLAAAQRLLQAGFSDLVVVEAQDRVGGRVHTVPHRQHWLELGAHWIHGEEDNVVYQWAAENSLVDEDHVLTQTGMGETTFVRHTGEFVSQQVLDQFEMVVANITEQSEKDFTTYKQSVGHYFTERFKSVNKWGKLGEELLDWRGRFQCSVDGCNTWYDISGAGQVIYQECPGNPVVNWKHGYQSLLTHLQEQLLPSQLHLNSPVQRVEWGVETSCATSGCRVILSSGEVISARHVIFTPSLAVLKATASQVFSPALPAKKLDAVEGLDISVVDKVFLEFPDKWWGEDCLGFSFLHNLQQEPITITRENWEHGLLGFYEVYKQPKMLCGWITGPAAQAMEGLSEDQVQDQCVRLLRSRLTHKFTIPDAVTCTRSTWGTNPWIRGAYSFRSMKSEEMGVWAADLAEPLLDAANIPLVCFAGEATHDHYYSTVHGAVETGQREAIRLLPHLTRNMAEGMVKKEERREAEQREKYGVVVVGAGAAGVGAARHLTSLGIKSVLILEGSDRVGGRVRSIPAGQEGFVNLGAQWIHGEEDNAIYKFASSRNLVHDHDSVDGRGTFLMEGGRAVPAAVVRQVLAVMEQASKDAAADRSVTHSHKLQGLSVGNLYRRKFEEYLKTCSGDSADMKKVKEALYHWVMRWERIDNACDSLHQLSTHCWGNYVFCEGRENMNPKHGFLSILEAVLQEAEVEVKLNSEVERIDYTEEVQVVSGGYVRRDGTTFPVIIRCKDGRQYEAQHVIVTCSLGFLKAHPQLFQPPLPARQLQAVQSIGFGTLAKIFLEYEEAWWEEDCEGIQVVWTEDIPDFERTAAHTRLLDGSTEQMEKYWVRAISGFDPVFHHKAMLCGWLGGPEACYMETLSEEEIGHSCTLLLRRFLGRPELPHPVRVYRSTWGSEHFFRGSYSHHPVGCQCTGEDSSNNSLNSPVCATTPAGEQVAVLVLAGEANSRKYYSTVHGAFQNGITQTAHYIATLKRFGHLLGTAAKSKM